MALTPWVSLWHRHPVKLTQPTIDQSDVLNYLNTGEEKKNRSDSLQRMGDEGVCKVRSDPSGPGTLTRNTSRARVLFFLEPATPMRASTSALRSFRMPTQSTLQETTANVSKKGCFFFFFLNFIFGDFYFIMPCSFISGDFHFIMLWWRHNSPQRSGSGIRCLFKAVTRKRGGRAVRLSFV